MTRRQDLAQLWHEYNELLLNTSLTADLPQKISRLCSLRYRIETMAGSIALDHVAAEREAGGGFDGPVPGALDRHPG